MLAQLGEQIDHAAVAELPDLSVMAAGIAQSVEAFLSECHRTVRLVPVGDHAWAAVDLAVTGKVAEAVAIVQAVTEQQPAARPGNVYLRRDGSVLTSATPLDLSKHPHLSRLTEAETAAYLEGTYEPAR